MAYRSVLYYMVFYYRRGVVSCVAMPHAVVVAVAGAQGYNAYYGKAPFDEFIHIFCFSIVNVNIKVVEQLKITRNKTKVKKKVIKIKQKMFFCEFVLNISYFYLVHAGETCSKLEADADKTSQGPVHILE